MSSHTFQVSRGHCSKLFPFLVEVSVHLGFYCRNQFLIAFSQKPVLNKIEAGACHGNILSLMRGYLKINWFSSFSYFTLYFKSFITNQECLTKDQTAKLDRLADLFNACQIIFFFFVLLFG